MSFQSLLEEKYVTIWRLAQADEKTLLGKTAWAFAVHRLAGMHDVLSNLDEFNVVPVYEKERNEITFLVNLAHSLQLLTHASKNNV